MASAVRPVALTTSPIRSTAPFISEPRPSIRRPSTAFCTVELAPESSRRAPQSSKDDDAPRRPPRSSTGSWLLYERGDCGRKLPQVLRMVVHDVVDAAVVELPVHVNEEIPEARHGLRRAARAASIR